MSIYVSICSLEDNELKGTINDIFSNSQNSQDIYLGLSITASKEFYDDIYETYKNFIGPVGGDKPISIKYFEPTEENLGIGNGRNNAASMYNNQDYFLQIDAHTMLDPGWDTQLIQLHKEAVEHTKNNKTILTGYCTPYLINDYGKRKYVRAVFNYPYFYWSDDFKPKKHNLPITQDKPLSQFPGDNLYFDKFMPCIKFNANFAFGNKEFAKNINLPIETVFWVEEIIQTINLLADGFALVFPNTEAKIFHFYLQNKDNEYGERLSLDKFITMSKTSKNGLANYIKYITNPDNMDKIKKWINYSQYDLFGHPKKHMYIPKDYK